MEVLLIESRGALLEAMWMDDGTFVEFISNLPNVTSLDLKLDCDITSGALTSLARTNPNIQSFDFYGEFNLSDWSRLTNPLSPNLLRFVIEAPFIEGRTRRYKIVIGHTIAMLKSRRVASARSASELHKSQMFCFVTVRN